MYDIFIVGAGPAGLSAGLRAKELNLNYLILERGKVCNLFLESYPKGKIVSDYPKDMDVKGNFWFKECKVEELIVKWKDIARNLNIKEGEEVITISKEDDEKKFLVRSKKNGEEKIYEAKNVIMAIGKEGKPRKLGIKGENLEKVFYKLKDKENFKEKRILIVGGGNSAIDAALLLCENNEVIISYRRNAFFRLNKENLERIKEKIGKNEIKVIFNSNLKEIKKKKVVLEVSIIRKNKEMKKEKMEIENDFVFIFAGSELPVDFFRKIKGVEIGEDNKVILDKNFQTTLNGLYVIGDAAGKPPFLIKPAINQGWEVVEYINKKDGL